MQELYKTRQPQNAIVTMVQRNFINRAIFAIDTISKDEKLDLGGWDTDLVQSSP